MYTNANIFIKITFEEHFKIEVLKFRVHKIRKIGLFSCYFLNQPYLFVASHLNTCLRPLVQRHKLCIAVDL